MVRDFDKFVVFKTEDAVKYLSNRDLDALQRMLEHIAIERDKRGQNDKHYVVVAEDWPMYEKVWNMIEEWVDAQ